MMHHFMTWGAILLLALASCQPAHRSQNPAATLPWSVDSLLHANHTHLGGSGGHGSSLGGI